MGCKLLQYNPWKVSWGVDTTKILENCLVVSTHVKNISQNGNLPQIGVKIKNIRNHRLEKHWKILEPLEKLVSTWYPKCEPTCVGEWFFFSLIKKQAADFRFPWK